MAKSFRIDALTYVFVFLNGFALVAKETEFTREIFVGDSIKVVLNETGKINLSRKGVIDVSQIMGNQWRITALRSGFVYLKQDWSESGVNKSKRISIRVSRKPSVLSPSMMKLCHRARVLCNQESGVVSGEISVPNTFYIMKKNARLKEGAFWANSFP